MPNRSQTTSASFVLPSSSTRHRACSSSWICVEGAGENPPTMLPPMGGVILLVAAPARNSSAAHAAAPCNTSMLARDTSTVNFGIEFRIVSSTEELKTQFIEQEETERTETDQSPFFVSSVCSCSKPIQVKEIDVVDATSRCSLVVSRRAVFPGAAGGDERPKLAGRRGRGRGGRFRRRACR